VGYILNIDNFKIARSYLNILKKGVYDDFWDADTVAEIRRMAISGKPQRIFRRGKRIHRILDRLSFGRDEIIITESTHRSDLSTRLAGISMSAPLYIGDMSFGALAGHPNVAIAKVADELGILAGIGEGGLHPEVGKYKRIMIQWASARFGIDIDVLMRGAGVVIKIGQGAKPGIGGHLPGNKVTQIISMVRRIPVGSDALSPAPHHDIYSIEDLKQRIDALKEATGGKPVLVKVAATNYVPYIVTGIARMGADGVIIDGHGAGTGATPIAVRDNVGIPIELAVASADAMLRKEGLREGFTIIAAGRVSSSDDAAKLMALGADIVSLGTSSLIAMGCIMARTCHTGNCPAGITSKLSSGTILVDLDFAVSSLRNYLVAFMSELGLLVDELGLGSVRELVGRRDLLRGYCISEELSVILGVSGECDEEPPLKTKGDLWNPQYMVYASQLAKRGDVVIVSMGSSAPPDVESPKKLIDWLRIDGAQVTKPSIDPYREDIDTSVSLLGGELMLTTPIILRPPGHWPREWVEAMKFVAHAMGVALGLWGLEVGEPRHLSRVMSDDPRAGVLIVDYPNEAPRDRVVYLRVPSSRDHVSSILKYSDHVRGFLIDDESGYDDVELVLVELDSKLRRAGLRYDLDILVHSRLVRSSGDVVKLLALGADAVILSSLLERSLHGIRGIEDFVGKLINFINSLRREVAQLVGAAGVYTLGPTVVGNKELLRSLDPRVKRLLNVKVAGEW